VQELDQLKNRFIQIVSHQFRTPLNVVRWNLESLLAEEMGPLATAQKEFMRLTYDANTAVIERIHDLLTALDIEEGRVVFTKEPTSLESLWGSVMADLQRQCTVKGIVCEYATPKVPLPAAEVDPEKIRAVFAKLADNAVAYTASGGRITASLGVREGRARLSIVDSGIGIPAAEQSRVFERFFRASNASTMRPDASGLSLPIAKHFVEQHGGSIGFSSVEGHGSTFWVDLPLRTEPAGRNVRKGRATRRA
jgi:two-component system, OmpR family, phosphate regulon sensor histidine kinase PhoR